MSSTVGWTAGEIAAAVHRGEVTPREVVRDHLEVIDRIDPVVGAFVQARGDQAFDRGRGTRGTSRVGPIAARRRPCRRQGQDGRRRGGDPVRLRRHRCHAGARRPRGGGPVACRRGDRGRCDPDARVGVWGTTDDAGGVTRTRGSSTGRRVAPRVGLRRPWRPAWFPWRRATTGWGPSASPRRRVVWWV